MATFYYLGGYGSGKSYLALKEAIYDELINGTRGIVTNLSLLQTAKVKGKTISNKEGLGALNALMNRRFKNLDCRVLQRVRLLKDDELSHFFCHRISKGGRHYDIPVPTMEQEKQGVRPDFSLIRDDGILFVIDEFHDIYNSRQWAEVGRSVGWYKNQQRKVNDDIHACTPLIDEVDKQLRTIGHEYKVCNNLGLRKVRGVVMPKTFICTVYTSLDSMKRGGRGHINKYPFTMDYELADCYDTAKGVKGLQGGSADIGKRPKGIHWLVPVLGLVGIVVLILALAIYFSHKMRKALNHETPAPKQSNVHHAFANNNVGTSAADEPPTSDDSARATGAPDEVQTNPIVCTGYVIIGRSVIATLTDGHSYSNDEGEVTAVTKRSVTVNGVNYPIVAGRMPVYVPKSVEPSYSPPQYNQPQTEYQPHDNVQVTIIGHHDKTDANDSRESGFSSMQNNFTQGITH